MARCLQADSEEGQELCDVLGVDTLPSLQFWKGGEKVWEHKGVVRLQEDLGEGAHQGRGWGLMDGVMPWRCCCMGARVERGEEGVSMNCRGSGRACVRLGSNRARPS